jgi:DNA-binding CsgD family transcriptional regulator
MRTMRALLEGRFADAERLASEARAIGERVGLPDAANTYRGQVVMLRGEQGRLGELMESYAAYVAGADVTAIVRCILAFIYAETDRSVDARRELERLAEPDFAAVPHNVNWLAAMLCLARACATLGDAPHAAVLYKLLAPHAHRIAVAGGAIVCFGAVSHYLGVLAATQRHWEAAARHFDDALDRNLRLRAPPLLARTRHAYAAMLLARDRAEDHARARELVGQALATAHELGMAGLEAQALAVREHLDRATSAADRTARYPAGLTAREVEVLGLVAAGRTNRENAAALVLSVPTVQNHLANIYRKIDARNRADATAFALRHRLTGPPASLPSASPD